MAHRPKQGASIEPVVDAVLTAHAVYLLEYPQLLELELTQMLLHIVLSVGIYHLQFTIYNLQ